MSGKKLTQMRREIQGREIEPRKKKVKTVINNVPTVHAAYQKKEATFTLKKVGGKTVKIFRKDDAIQIDRNPSVEPKRSPPASGMVLAQTHPRQPKNSKRVLIPFEDSMTKTRTEKRAEKRKDETRKDPTKFVPSGAKLRKELRRAEGAAIKAKRVAEAAVAQPKPRVDNSDWVASCCAKFDNRLVEMMNAPKDPAKEAKKAAKLAAFKAKQEAWMAECDMRKAV